jgi:prepilin-type N-terminal cleavage/methylation domain-containing protein
VVFFKKSNGFTLIEVLVALVILSIALLSLAGLMATTTSNNAAGGHLTEAATLAQDTLERLRVAPLGDIPLTYNTTTVAPSGITYTWGWVASQPIPTLDTITITVNWTDPIRLQPHTITMVSTIPQYQ